MTLDETLHYLGGFTKAAWRRCFTSKFSTTIIEEIDLYGFYREWDQNLEGVNPNVPMSNHQLAEARAWGDGARAAARVNPPRPAEYVLGFPPGWGMR